jgi:class 3 adenylate cyclase
VQCAVAVQAAITTENAGGAVNEPMQFRIGVHVGDVMVDGENLLGDGVNIAARLESLAEPGAICVSAVVRDQVLATNCRWRSKISVVSKSRISPRRSGCTGFKEKSRRLSPSRRRRSPTSRRSQCCHSPI